MIKTFLFTRIIGKDHFSVMIPCLDWDDANDIAAKTGMEAVGCDVHTSPCVPVFQFMQFCHSLADGDRIPWKPHAEEQIEAFLSAGWPEQPHEAE